MICEAGDVAVVFLFQRIAVVFEMVEDVERAMPLVFDKAGADLIAAQQGLQARHRIDLVLPHLGPARHRDHAIVGKPP